ncbi:MAG: RsmD family RNA methyltransferase [Treponema sp.]|jgi:16S rRNA (guanine(966)-N(2))-methyltransferase RsmD|nr:RsmD family RNA methyltransferase [Treponema sp.]
MRITGGMLKGRQVYIPPGVIRPSMDRMRESVFAILGDLAGLSFLDLFSGTGIIALEAASRGAGPIETVEADPGKRSILIKNISIAPVRIQCHFMAAELYVKRAKKTFDVIFCDPPFRYGYKWELIGNIAASPLVNRETRLLIHHPREDRHEEEIPSLSLKDRREYGRSVVDFYQGRKNDPSNGA